MSNEMQQYAVCFILLQNHSTCFGCRPHPSSGVHQTVTAASGTSHMSVQLASTWPCPRWSEVVAQTMICTGGCSYSFMYS